MTTIEEYQELIKQLENKGLELEKRIHEEREQGIDQINQKLDNTHILRFENGEYKVQTYLRNDENKSNWSFKNGQYYYNRENGTSFSFEFLTKLYCSWDKDLEKKIANDLSILKNMIEKMEVEKDLCLSLARTIRCVDAKPINIRRFFIGLFQLNIQTSNALAFYLFGKFIAQNCKVYKENVEAINRTENSVLEQKLIKAYFALGNYFDKKGNLILYGPMFNKNGELDEKANLEMFQHCIIQNVRPILSIEASPSNEDDGFIMIILQSLRNCIYCESAAQYFTLLENEVAKINREKSSQVGANKNTRKSRKAMYQKQQEAITELATYWDGTDFIKPCEDLEHFNDLLLLANISEEQRCVMISKMEKFILEEKKYRHFTPWQKEIYLAAKKSKQNLLIRQEVAEIDAALELLEQEEDKEIKQELDKHMVSLKNILG